MVLIIVFAIANALTHLVDPPQYSPVFAFQGNYRGIDPFEFKVDGEGRLTVNFEFTGPNINIQTYYFYARVYIFNPKTNQVEEFELSPPEEFESGQTIPIEVPEKLSEITLLDTAKAPDGYIMEKNSRSRGNIFTNIFGYRNYNYSRYVLKKKGRVVPVPQEKLSYSQFTFIGWISGGGDRQ